MTSVALDAGDDPRRRMRALWAKACLWDGISPQCSFVVFSAENPYNEEYDQAYREWQDWLYPKKEV